MNGVLQGVDIRLDTREFIGHTVRIYLVLPVAIAGLNGLGSMELSWRTRGRLNAGMVRPGQDAVIFEGPIEHQVTEEIFDFVLSIEGGDVADSFTFEPKYELEIIS